MIEAGFEIVLWTPAPPCTPLFQNSGESTGAESPDEDMVSGGWLGGKFGYATSSS